MVSFPRGIKQLPYIWSIILSLLHHRRAVLILTGIGTADTNFPSLPIRFLPISLSMKLQNTLFIIMEFQSCFWSKSSFNSKWSAKWTRAHGILWSSYVTHCLIADGLIGQGNGLFEDCYASSWSSVSCTNGLISSGIFICSISATSIPLFLSHPSFLSLEIKGWTQGWLLLLTLSDPMNKNVAAWPQNVGLCWSRVLSSQ